jgi:hypothetical protein
MSSSESDDSIDELDDSSDDMYDDDISHLTSLFNSLLSAEKPEISIVPSVDKLSSHTIRSAFGVSSGSSAGTTASSSIFDDSIRSYVEAPPLFQPTANLSTYYLSIDPTVTQADSNPLASENLFIANVNYVAKWSALRDFFINLGYNVIRVDLPNNHKKVNSRSCDR